MYSDAKYINDPTTEIPTCIKVNINGAICYVPIDPENTDYQNIMQLVAEGKLVIAPADQ